MPFFSSDKNKSFLIDNAYFASASYTDGHLSERQVKEGWKPLTSKDLPGIINKNGYFELLGIAAQVFVNGKKTVISIRGSDDLIDKVIDDGLGIVGTSAKSLDGYAKHFTALLKAIGGNKKYNGDIVVTGHSLGGGAVNKISENPSKYGLPSDTKFIAYASPYVVKTAINFGHDNEPIYKYISKDSGLSYDNVSYFGYYEDKYTSTIDSIAIMRSHSRLAIIDTLEKIGNSDASDFISKDAHVNTFGFSKKTVLVDGERFNYIDISNVVKDSVSVNLGVNTSYKTLTKNDFIFGSKFATVIDGMGGNDYITGSEKNDSLYGGAGRDDISGRAGNDLIWGGSGNDILTGGSGSDHFIFTKKDIGDTDTITDFKHGDKINLRHFDGVSSIKGTQPLVYIGDDDFTGRAGQIRVTEGSKSSYVRIDVNGDKKSDLTIVVKGDTDLSINDFLGVKKNHSYEVVTSDKMLTWAEANAAAKAKGGHLVTITSAAENAKVFNLVNDPKYWVHGVNGVWIGGYQDAKAAGAASNWHWVTGEKWNFTAWSPYNPDDGGATGNQDRLQLWAQRGAVWDDVDGSLNNVIKTYVVEYDGFLI